MGGAYEETWCRHVVTRRCVWRNWRKHDRKMKRRRRRKKKWDWHCSTYRHAHRYKHAWHTTVLHTNAFTSRRFKHRHFYIHKSLYAQALVLQTDAVTQKTLYTQTLQHTEVLTHRSILLYQTLLNTDPLAGPTTCSKNSSFLRSNLISCKNVALADRPSP